MEKKTIGSFIATLRKANGMTQKELAERLNVSDKTVSRWECDDGTPDLSIIPTIAEIFGVTCDELLRGERKSPATRTEMSENMETTPRGERERQRLLKSSLSQYQNLTYIAMGVSVIGMLAALICNLAFLKAVLGFLVGAIFFAASLVCQAIFVNKAFLSVEDAGLEADSLSDFKRKVILSAEKSIGLTVGFIGFTFPLVMVDAYLGLSADSLLIWGGIGAVLFLGMYAIALYFFNASLLKRGVYHLPDEQMRIYQHNHQLKKKYGLGLAILLILTLLIHAFGSEMIWSTHQIASANSLVFEDYETFIAFMEQDIPYDYHWSDSNGTISIPVPEESWDEPTYYDMYGNEISEEEALTETIEDSNGNIVCTYMKRNESVASVLYTQKEGTVLPIRVITNEDYRDAASISNWINTAYCLIYPMELLGAVLIYFKKRA